MSVSIYAPPYYKDFKCLADACRHTCCAGWRIGLDEETMRIYSGIGGELGEDIRAHIDEDEDGAYIPLDEFGRCPHLTGSGLCRIISKLGHESVSEICREHPRFYNICDGRVEVGLGLSCEAAASLVLSSDEYLPTEMVGETDLCNGGDGTAERDHMLRILASHEASYRDKARRLIEAYGICEDVEYSDKWQILLGSLEFKDDDNKAKILARPCNSHTVNEGYLEKFLAYMIYRHVTCADGELDTRARLGFAILSASVFENMAASSGASTLSDYADLARIYSEEIEYSESNTESLIFEIECDMI